MRPDTVLVSVMTVNNEIGVKQPVVEIGMHYILQILSNLAEHKINKICSYITTILKVGPSLEQRYRVDLSPYFPFYMA